MSSDEFQNSTCSIKNTKSVKAKSKTNHPKKHICNVSTKSPNCVLVDIKGHEVHALLDSGADVSVLRLDMYNKLKTCMQLELQKSTEVLRNASGKYLKVIGETVITFHIGSQMLKQKVQVTRDIRVPFLLGTDFLMTNDVRIWISRGTVTVNGETFPLGCYDQLSSLVRLCESISVPPQTAVCTWGKIKAINEEAVMSLSQADSGFLRDQPGLGVMNSVSNVVKSKYVPLTITNATGREFFISAGCVLAKVHKLEESEINWLNTQDHNPDQNQGHDKVDLKYEDVS